jgi:hypothetical protein
MIRTAPPLPAPAGEPDANGGAQALEASHLLDAARTRMNTALREEGKALADACETVNTKGAASTEAAGALRFAQAAHARSSFAIGAVRALTRQAGRDDAAARPA